MGDGEGFDVGDRVLRAIRPPVFDAPTTRGLYDPTTGVYWASDSFATPMLTPGPHGRRDRHRVLGRRASTPSPATSARGSTLVADDRFQATVDRVAALRPSVMAGCHTPAISGRRVDAAIATVRQSPAAVVPDEPDQAVLEQIQHALQTLAA